MGPIEKRLPIHSRSLFKFTINTKKKKHLQVCYLTGILEQIMLESLSKRRRDNRIIMLYKGLNGVASIPTSDIVLPIMHVGKHHSLAFPLDY